MLERPKRSGFVTMFAVALLRGLPELRPSSSSSSSELELPEPAPGEPPVVVTVLETPV